MNEIMHDIRALAYRIPCALCVSKGGDNISEDGGCRHRSGDFDNSHFDHFAVEKLTDFINRHSTPKKE